MVIRHWTLLTAVWMYPDRSLVKAAHTVRRYSVMLASAMAGSLAVFTSSHRLAYACAPGVEVSGASNAPALINCCWP